MLTKEVTIRNASGFHIRPAQLFTEKATTFQSKIKVNFHKESDTVEADGKSILGLMTLGLEKGSVITLSADGPDEREALDSLVELVESGFGEA
ncbi:HPr family phosphocarrier protein [Paenibacillus ehimensis]|uniref:Phosphocarrier protein HPr n=1 Tax=Paenibacillus ehimensis TaxID=79264 RepID=A0ABT8V4A6_9BACL|nr:HPr family phosphocarrier protein [Paenibacillus ehimensis]MDO3676254.1 HPr family phosphocarrier protein [Paenibacillus ehimensis]MEC0210065.1 HPr family phosphocarrier protein [Paenibacillus ehimensis]